MNRIATLFFLFICATPVMASNQVHSDPSIVIQILQAVFTFILVASTALAAQAAQQSAKAAKDATYARFITDFYEQYGSKEMKHHLRELAARENQIDALPEQVLRNIDDSRRAVHWFYKTAWTLYQQKLINRETLSVITPTNGYRIFHNVVVPLTRRVHPGLDVDEHLAWVRELRKEFPVAEELRHE